jgi:hexokinase
MASKIPWGPSQTLDVWAVDVGCDSSWKIRKIEHFEKMIKSMFLDRLANLVVEVVEKRYQEFVDEEVVEEVVLWAVLVSLAKHKQQLMQA